MKTTTEIEINVSNGRIIVGECVIPDGRYKLVIQEPTESENVAPKDNVFVKVEASKLSLEDEFMKHKPKTRNETKFMEEVANVIKNGPKDFWRPKYDPSVINSQTDIYYHPKMAPATETTYKWWDINAKRFKPECKSRLGTKSEYIAFLAVLIKKLMENGWTVENAWNAVCEDSKELGHYCDSEDAKHGLECTGCREVCGFFDLGNTFKLLAEDEKTENDGYWLVGGCCDNHGRMSPLSELHYGTGSYELNSHSCGWLILEDYCTDL